MTELTYHVRKASAGWLIENAGNEYTGYRSGAGAIKSAIDVAQKLSLNGHVTQVILHDADGTSKVVWASDNAPPSIDSLLNA